MPGLEAGSQAMAYWRLGKRQEAGKWYAQAHAWMEKYEPDNEELQRFRDESRTLLRAKHD
jgi:hypothetical protein